MIFLFRQKPIQLDCFTANPTTYKATPIAPATDYIPDWWKNLPKSMEGNQTMKSCAGLVDLYRKSVVIPSWSEVAIAVGDTDGQSTIRVADFGTAVDFHDKNTVGDFFNLADVMHMKLISPWAFVCKEGVYWHFTQPVWGQMGAKDYLIPDGVVEFKTQHAANVNILARRGRKEIFIPHNSALAHMTPLSERTIKIHNHLVSTDEFAKKATRHVAFARNYYKAKKAIEIQETKCPFGGLK